MEKWDVGGRQREGTNTANCVVRDSSTVGHLFKFSFTEITLAPKAQLFAFDDSLQFDFDMEVRVSSSGGAPSNYYGKAGVVFNLFSEDTTSIGRVSYMAATTNYPFSSNTSTSVAVKVQQNTMTSYSITPNDLLSYLSIDVDGVSFIGMTYLCYSSTRPIPYVEAELWIDNVVVSTTSD